ncbi:hypothetical protein BC833DRAFT_582810 [Globomyces pollinis-pini]|nr:hypothetical protein BC833DRAFT_582810 [Globomyces pollinis-pini]
MPSIMIFTSFGSLKVEYSADATIEWLFDHCAVRFPNASFVEARTNTKQIAKKEDTIASVVADSSPSLLLLTNPETIDLPDVALTFYEEELTLVQENIIKNRNILSELHAKKTMALKEKNTIMRTPVESVGINRIQTVWDKINSEENTDVDLKIGRNQTGLNKNGITNVTKSRIPPRKTLARGPVNSLNDLDESSRLLSQKPTRTSIPSRKSVSESRLASDSNPSKIRGSSPVGPGEPGPPPPPPPPPPGMGGPPPPPPPPGMGGPPPPPPPPGMGGPPPPPAPPGSGGPPPPPPPTAASSSGPVDIQAELKKALSGNPMARLRKVKRPEPSQAQSERSIASTENLTPEQLKEREERDLKLAKERQAVKDAETRQNLLFEMLGFMETPNGSIEDLIEKLTKNTAIARGYVYTLVSRQWVKACKVKVTYPDAPPVAGKTKHVPFTVFPGREWLKAIELEEYTEEELDAKFPNPLDKVEFNAHLYQFNQQIQKHVVDKIVFFKGDRYPDRYTPFDKVEPPQDNSLQNRNRWELWYREKQMHFETDPSQYHLITSKLAEVEQVILPTFEILEGTIIQIRETNEAVSKTFENYDLAELKKLVESIPDRIKTIGRSVQDESGIIIKDANLKITEKFITNITSMNDVKSSTTSLNEGKVEPQGTTSLNAQGKEEDDMLISFGGLSIEKILPMIDADKLQRIKTTGKKLSRSKTQF